MGGDLSCEVPGPETRETVLQMLQHILDSYFGNSNERFSKKLLIEPYMKILILPRKKLIIIFVNVFFNVRKTIQRIAQCFGTTRVVPTKAY